MFSEKGKATRSRPTLNSHSELLLLARGSATLPSLDLSFSRAELLLLLWSSALLGLPGGWGGVAVSVRRYLAILPVARRVAGRDGQ